jgi:hypothetical protein
LASFYLTSKGYQRDIKKNDAPKSELYRDIGHLGLGVPTVSLPIPTEGFTDADMEYIDVVKDKLPKKICDNTAGLIISEIKRQPVPAF